MVDIIYVRGWQDCLDAIEEIINKSANLTEAKNKIQQLQKLIRENKFEKIRYELGAYSIF
ncbi:MAG: hypothetical protein QXR76_03425 [Candidatus Bathyarchaeia archaeon]